MLYFPENMNDGSGRIIGSQYGVVKNILKNLPMLHLKQSRQVCQMWNNVAKIIMEERRSFRATSFCWSYGDQDASNLNDFIGKLMIEPKMIIAFVPYMNSCSEFSYLKKHFPNSLILGGDKEVIQVSILFVPDWPGVKIHPVVMDTDPDNQDYSTQGPLDGIKASILISPSWSANDFCEKIISRNPLISLGGCKDDIGWSSECGVDFMDLKYVLSVGFSLTGDKVRSSTVVVTKEMKTEKDIRTQIEKLKGKVCEDNSYAVIFSSPCYEEKLKVFFELFPKTPVIHGISSWNQIGFDTKSESEPAENQMKLVHEGSIIITVISTA